MKIIICLLWAGLLSANSYMAQIQPYDISKSKIELFVRAKEIKDIEKKSIFIDGNASSFQIEKISRVRGSHNLSSFFLRLIKISRLNPSILNYNN